jgi:phenylacetate-CoA ligase
MNEINQIDILDKAFYLNDESKLQTLAEYVYNNSIYWRNVFDQNQINVEDFDSNSLRKLPVISKKTLESNLEEMICVDKSKIIDYVSTSGTTSKPVYVPLTNNDLERLAHNEYLSFVRTGATSNDVFQICITLDKMFMAGIAYFLGLKKLGAGVIRLGVDSLEMHWKTILDLKPTYLIAVPSFVLKLIEFAKTNNIDYKESSVKKIICIGENIRDIDLNLNMCAKNILDAWEVQLFSSFASTEMATSFTECSQANGGHHNKSLLYVELLDEFDNPVKNGEIGELTITNLGVEALPLLRYKTGDLCKFYTRECECGENTLRVSPILGRKEQRIKYKGTSFYPSTIFEILNGVQNIKDSIIEIESDILGFDKIIVYIECSGDVDLRQINENIKSVIRVSPEVFIVDSLNVYREKNNLHKKRKLTRVVDLRVK